MTTAELTYKDMLDRHRMGMIGYMQGPLGVKYDHAVLMVDQLWRRWTARMVEEYPGMSAEEAERRLNECLGYLRVAAEEDGHGPAPEVDKALHVMMLYPEFEAFCYAAFGHRIRHWPADVIGIHDLKPGRQEGHCACGAGPCSARSLQETVQAMAAKGPVDAELWQR